MTDACRHTIRRLALKGLMAAVLLVLLAVVYRYTLYPADLEAHCTLMQRSQLPVSEGDDIIYLGESSNHAVADDEPDQRFISDMLQDLLPGHRVGNLDKDACHAGVYYDIMRNIPAQSPVRTAVVTVNIRSFSTEWIYSDLETALNKERVMMKKAPALYRRMLLAFKGYTHWSEAERNHSVRDGLRHQRFDPPAGLPYTTAAQWDRAVANDMWSRGVSQDTIVLATHYVKCFACQVDGDNPRIRDLDRIVRLCRQRGWHLVLNILPDNEQQMTELVGPELVELVRRNGSFVEQRYRAMGVTVVNNQGIVADADFRDRDFPTEHYRQAGRQAIATALAAAIRMFEMMSETNTLQDKLHENTDYFLRRMKEEGFDCKPSESAICAVMIYDAVKSQQYAAKMQEEGIFVTGFYYPVVPKGQARIRVQISAAHEHEHLDKCIEAFKKVRKEIEG